MKNDIIPLLTAQTTESNVQVIYNFFVARTIHLGGAYSYAIEETDQKITLWSGWVNHVLWIDYNRQSNIVFTPLSPGTIAKTLAKVFAKKSPVAGFVPSLEYIQTNGLDEELKFNPAGVLARFLYNYVDTHPEFNILDWTFNYLPTYSDWLKDNSGLVASKVISFLRD